MHASNLNFDRLQPPASNPISSNGAARHNGARPFPADINSIFGEQTLTVEMMRETLPRDVYKKLQATVEHGARLDTSVAEAAAVAMKKWAIEHGATHFTHWFQPLTGSTAEKHDSFVTPNKGGGAMYEFSGKDLIQGEPDASSFPSGGLRATFEARGYTAWDPTSPVFIIENPRGATLCIPTVFASWTGEALDHKTPLLRSIDALSREACKALKLFDMDEDKVVTTVGAEQEYFLVDREYFYRRPDLVACGRTLFGAPPPRGQELSDHYFGSIPDRVLAYMSDVEYELYRLGVPVKTRHNEVAPGQYELAPIFEHSNIAADHQHQIMQTLRRLAGKYGLVCLLHEKPFAGLNGSGKHNNWSMSTPSGVNLLEPGDTPHSNRLFLFFCTAVLTAVDRHQDILRASVANAGNDHRLGGHEAPPAIISAFLGEQLSAIFRNIVEGTEGQTPEAGLLGLGVPTLPPLPRHAGDRNRTSPFAFTGNKFEFRALGSSQTISFVNAALNTMVAESIADLTAMVEAKMTEGKTFPLALRATIKHFISKHQRIIFDGDGYSQEWMEEAEKRGLLNLKNSVDAYAALEAEKNAALFEKYEVLNKRELKARVDVMYDQYFKTISIEVDSSMSIAQRIILPAALRAMNEIGSTLRNVGKVDIQSAETRGLLERLTQHTDELQRAIAQLHDAAAIFDADCTADDLAAHTTSKILPAMEHLRTVADTLEKLVPDNLWPLPSYEEMLYIK